MSVSTQKPLSFDFNAAVADARRDYPEQLKDMTFVNLDDKDALAEIALWVTARSGETIDMLSSRGSLSRMTPDSYGFSVPDPYSDAKLLASHGTFLDALTVFRDDPYKQVAFVFLHELGHLVIRIADQSGNPDENAADAFALLRGMQLGIFDKDDVKRVADARINAYLDRKDTEHITTAALDWIYVNPDDIDFMSLKPLEVAAIAKAYGKALGASVEEETAFLTAHVRSTEAPAEWEKMMRLAALALTTDGGSANFYIAARILNRALAAGAVDENLPVGEVQGPAFWNAVREVLSTKSQGLAPRMKRVLEETAPPAAAAARKMAPPA